MIRRKVEKIRHLMEANAKIFKNFTWLTILQLSNYIIPIVIIPYIVRVLGTDMYGKISFAQNIISYLTLLINFGFEYSATRYISIVRDNEQEMRAAFWAVMKQKAILLVLSFAMLVGYFYFVERENRDFTLYFFVFLINVGMVLFPTWFFQGMQEMKRMSIFNFVIKFLGLVLTLLLVKKASDYLLYPLFASLSYIICGGVALIYTIRVYGMRYKKADKALSKTLFRESFPIFLNNLFVSLYTASNITFLGIYYTDNEVGLYSGVHKIIMAILMVTSMPVNTSIFPHISAEFKVSKEKGIIFFKKILCIIVPISLFISIVTLLCSKELVLILLGKEFETVIYILKFLSVIPLLVITASLLTVQGLYGMGLQRKAPYIGLFIGLFTVAMNILFIPKYGMLAASLNWIIAQILEILIVGTILKISIRNYEKEIGRKIKI